MKQKHHTTPEGKDYTYKTKPLIARELKSPRWYWIVMLLTDETEKRIRKYCTWDGAIGIGNNLAGLHRTNLDIILLYDGNLPEPALQDSPPDAIWCRWEPSGFTEHGRHSVAVDPAAELLERALVTARGL